jgi:hypothetical protein
MNGKPRRGRRYRRRRRISRKGAPRADQARIAARLGGMRGAPPADAAATELAAV